MQQETNSYNQHITDGTLNTLRIKGGGLSHAKAGKRL